MVASVGPVRVRLCRVCLVLGGRNVINKRCEPIKNLSKPSRKYQEKDKTLGKHSHYKVLEPKRNPGPKKTKP